VSDSVISYQKGDSVFITHIKYKYLWRDKTDSLRITDTLAMTKTIVKKEVIRKTDWKKTLGFGFGVALGLIGVTLIIKRRLKRV